MASLPVRKRLVSSNFCKCCGEQSAVPLQLTPGSECNGNTSGPPASWDREASRWLIACFSSSPIQECTHSDQCSSSSHHLCDSDEWVGFSGARDKRKSDGERRS